MALAFQSGESVKQALFEELQNLLNADKDIRTNAEGRIKQLEFTEGKKRLKQFRRRSQHENCSSNRLLSIIFPLTRMFRLWRLSCRIHNESIVRFVTSSAGQCDVEKVCRRPLG